MCPMSRWRHVQFMKAQHKKPNLAATPLRRMKPHDNFLSPHYAPPGIKKKRETLRYRTMWISDIHLGTPGCQATKLLEFLRATDTETLYLVGDIVDGWQLKRRWFWDQHHNNIVQLILKK